MSNKDGLPDPEPDFFSATCGCKVRIHCQLGRRKQRACVLYTQRYECVERQMGQVISMRTCTLDSEIQVALQHYALKVRDAGWTLVREPRELN